MKILFSGLVLILLGLVSSSGHVFLCMEDFSTLDSVQDNKEKINALELLDKVKQRYLDINFYKSKGINTYSKKLTNSEVSTVREIDIEYFFSSNLEAKVTEGKDIKLLSFKNGDTEFFINGEKKDNPEDVAWGLSSINFGDGDFFELAKILVQKERGKGRILSLENLIDPEMLEEEVIDGNLCYKIQSKLKNDNLAKKTFWIDKKLFLIRQYEIILLSKKIPDGYFKTVETYTDIEFR